VVETFTNKIISGEIKSTNPSETVVNIKRPHHVDATMRWEGGLSLFEGRLQSNAAKGVKGRAKKSSFERKIIISGVYNVAPEEIRVRKKGREKRRKVQKPYKV